MTSVVSARVGRDSKPRHVASDFTRCIAASNRRGTTLYGSGASRSSFKRPQAFSTDCTMAGEFEILVHSQLLLPSIITEPGTGVHSQSHPSQHPLPAANSENKFYDTRWTINLKKATQTERSENYDGNPYVLTPTDKPKDSDHLCEQRTNSLDNPGGLSSRGGSTVIQCLCFLHLKTRVDVTYKP